MPEKPEWIKEWPRVEGKIPGPKSREIIKRDEKILSPSYTRSEPLVGEEGWGPYIKDADDNVFLDLSSGMFVLNYGYSNPYITQQLKNRLDTLTHFAGTHYYYELQLELAERLAEITPGKMNKRVLFANSGAEAVEAAFKLVRWHTRRPLIISYKGAFHGRTYGALSLSSGKAQHRKFFSPMVPGVNFMPFPYCYRCPFNETYPDCDFECVDYIRDSLKKDVPAEEVGAVITEPIQGNSGYITPPDEYFPMIKELCEENDWLFISDEIQAGLGRTGKMFAIEHWNVVPDITCVAKALSGGTVPMGAIIAKEEVMTWERDSHASTFGGNLLGSSAAIAGLDLIKEQNLVEKAKEKGEMLEKRLKEMKEDHQLIGDVRGKGLLRAIELVKDRETKERAKDERSRVVQKALDKGVVIFEGGLSSIRIAPPLIIRKDELQNGLDVIDEALSEVEKECSDHT